MDGVGKNSEGLSRREREKENRRLEILRAARELFIQRGYENTTLEDIAHHAEFGKGTIYNYFSSKDELFDGILVQLMDEITGIIETSMMVPGDARVKFTMYAKIMLTYARENLDLFNLIGREWVRKPSEEFEAKRREGLEMMKKHLHRMAQPLRDDMEAGKIKPANAEHLAILFGGMLKFYSFNIEGPLPMLEPMRIDEAVSLIVSTFFDGISTQKTKE